MGFKNGSAVGLEIGKECINLVEFEFKEKEPAIKRCRSLDTPPSLVNPSLSVENISDEEKFKGLIKNLFHSSFVKEGRISVALPDDSVKTAFLEFEDIPKEREKVVELIKWNLKKTLSFPVDEAVVDYQIIDAPSEKKSSYKLAIILMRKSVLNQYERLLNACNLSPQVILPSSLAVYNLYHDILPQDKTCCMLAASGRRINIMGVKNRRPFFHRNKEVDDERRGVREILASLNYYQGLYQTLPHDIYFVDMGLDLAYLKVEIKEYLGLPDIKSLDITEIIKGATPSLNNISAAAGAALRYET